MQSMVIDQFGEEGQIHPSRLPTPEPRANEVQIAIEYAAVNPVDWKICYGYFVKRMPHIFPIILGWDAAGKISKVGKDVKDFNVGDAVFAYCKKQIIQWGTFAEFVCVEAANAAKIPSNINFAEAAAIPLTSLTAWQALFEAGHLQKGQKVLIQAGAGGVGGMAIQFAKTKGAYVFTTASKNHHDYVKKLGADVAIDYHEDSVIDKIREKAPEGVDLVLDTIGGKTLVESAQIVKKEGFLVSIIEPPDEAKLQRKDLHLGYVFVRSDGKQLKEIADLLQSKIVKPPQIEIMPLRDVREALTKLRTGHVLGKIVLKIH